jgi:hypothetical protein
VTAIQTALKPGVFKMFVPFKVGVASGSLCLRHSRLPDRFIESRLSNGTRFALFACRSFNPALFCL